MTKPYSRHAPPKASSLIESLRGLGYSTATALADIIDNSIAARANQVDLLFSWQGEQSNIAILDDGDGLDEQELDRAMRLGEMSPLDARAPHDLGRFGMGLKTASFSQCRRLTVASQKDGKHACLRWDLDVLASSKDDGWYMLEGPDPSSKHLFEPLNGVEHGTLVLWEVLDRIISPGFAQQNFLDLVDIIERHLAMVFHRYLQGGTPRMRIKINGRPVSAWDPFLIYHPATWSSPVERLKTIDGPIEVQCHVLPHKDRLGQAEHDSAAGPDGWTAQQGFYIYRNERLLVSGSWVGLGQGRFWTKEEAFRLARIRLDIPNTADSAWKIDIRKSTAKPPIAVRDRLTWLAEDTRQRARRVFAHRGRAVRVGGDPLIQAWRSEHFAGGFRYRIDEEHPAVKGVLDEGGALTAQIRVMLRVIEETLPVQRIWLDTSDGKETPRTGFAGEPSSEVIAVLGVMFRNLVHRKGISPNLARQQLLRTEPFHDYPELVAALPNESDPEK